MILRVVAYVSRAIDPLRVSTLSSEWRARTSERSIRRGFQTGHHSTIRRRLSRARNARSGDRFSASNCLSMRLSRRRLFCLNSALVTDPLVRILPLIYKRSCPGSKCNCHNTYHEFSVIQSGISLIGNSGDNLSHTNIKF